MIDESSGGDMECSYLIGGLSEEKRYQAPSLNVDNVVQILLLLQ